jgi:hypothetical protein
MEKDKLRKMVAQVFNLYNLFKLPGGICPTGRSLEGFISLLGDARMANFFFRKNARSPWTPFAAGTARNGLCMPWWFYLIMCMY